MSMNPLRPSSEQANERQELSAAFGAGAEPDSPRISRATPGKLLTHYVYGTLRQFEPGRCHLDAPLEDLIIEEPFTFDAATDVHSLYGRDLAAVPIGARIEAGTPDELRNEDGTRHALWVNVNPIYSHGDVISKEGEDTITLQQAHGGSVRTLIVDSGSTINSRTGDLAAVEPGHHVFFTGMGETAELSCARIHVVLLNHV